MKRAGFFSPPFYWQRIAAALLAGLLIGAAGTGFFSGRKVEKTEREKERLLEELKKEQLQVERLTKSLQEKRTRVVTRLTIDLEVGDPFHEGFFRGVITELLGELVGMEVSRVDPRLVYTILDGRVLEVKNELYECSVHWVLISETVEVGVTVDHTTDTRSE
jgi:hypothetical protein